MFVFFFQFFYDKLKKTENCLQTLLINYKENCEKASFEIIVKKLENSEENRKIRQTGKNFSKRAKNILE